MSLIVSAPKKKEKQSPYTYAWVSDSDVDSYSLHIAGVITQRIWVQDGVWCMRTTVYNNGKSGFAGHRPTLEEAAKASERLLYKNFPHVWTVTDARAIMKSWKGDLRFDEI